MEADDDLKKLTVFLAKKQQTDCSDSDSTDSDELRINCELLEDIRSNEFAKGSSKSLQNNDILDPDTNIIINTCTNPTLKIALERNIQKRCIMQEIINRLETYLVEVETLCDEYRIKTHNELTDNKKNFKKRLGVPYFKDKSLFPSPVNEDYLKMKDNKQLMHSLLPVTNTWTKDDKNILARVVYENICEKKVAQIENEIKSLQKKEVVDESTEDFLKLQIAKYENKDIIHSAASKWNVCTTGHCNKRCGANASAGRSEEEQLIVETVSQWDNNGIDWLKVCTENFNSRHDEIECKVMWAQYVHPTVSQEPWTSSDNRRLIELAKKHKYQDWEAIASDMGIHKSPFQCCVHFHSKLCEKFNKDRWTPEEEKLLKEVVDLCSTGDYISWGKVAYYFKDRTKAQIYNHYKRSMQPNLKKGQFTIAEDVLLLVAEKLLGRHKSKIKQYFPNRTVAQLHDRFKTMRTDDLEEWTLSQDVKIIEYVEKFGDRNWQNLDLPRSVACLRHRYHTLKKWFERNPTETLENVPRRSKARFKSSMEKRATLVKAAVEHLLADVANATDKQLVLNLTYIEENILSKFPEYPKPRKPRAPLKKKVAETNLDNVLINFFQTSYKSVARHKSFISKDVIQQSANRIEFFLKMLNANLQLPSIEDVNAHPVLDEEDKAILVALIIKKDTEDTNEHVPSACTSRTLRNPAASSQAVRLIHLIPPSPETLIGFRSLLLHFPILRAHTKGQYEGYNMYLRQNNMYSKYTKRVSSTQGKEMNFLSTLDEETRKIVVQRRQLFWERFVMTFRWPCVLSELKQRPPVERLTSRDSTLAEDAAGQSGKKRGRPTNSRKHYKIELMNKARLEKINKDRRDSNQVSDTLSASTTQEVGVSMQTKKRKRDS